MKTPDRLQAVADAALASLKPVDVSVHWIADYNKAYFDVTNRCLYIPHPKTTGSLFVLLHELGHVVAKDPGNIVLPWATNYINPPHAECIASHWARHYMEANSIVVDEACWSMARGFWQAEERNRNEKLTP